MQLNKAIIAALLAGIIPPPILILWGFEFRWNDGSDDLATIIHDRIIIYPQD